MIGSVDRMGAGGLRIAPARRYSKTDKKTDNTSWRQCMTPCTPGKQLRPASPLRALTLAVAALSLGAPLAFAAGAIEEVTVTAQKREENLQNTPIAMSALSADTLEKMGISDFNDVAKASPSIHFTTYPSSNMLTLYMRGQGINDPMQITADGSVGLYQDGFYVGRPLGAIFELADLERVEVLRGPQGTLYGRNTTGGAVNMIAKRPTGEFGFKQSFTVGTRDLFRSLTTIDLPAWNDAAAKVTVLKSSQDGLVKNTGNSRDFGESEQLSGRLDLHWNVNDALAADYFFETGELNSTPQYFQNEQVAQSGRVAGYGQAETRRGSTYRDIDLPEGTSRFENHGLTFAWDVSDAFTVKSLTGYRELKVDGYQEYAEALGTAVSTNANNAYDGIQSYTFSQEFQFIGNALDDRIRYVSGLYYYHDSASHYQDFFTGINATPTYVNSIDKLRDVNAEAQSLAAYGQVTWRPPILDDRFEATLGGRAQIADQHRQRTDVRRRHHHRAGLDRARRQQRPGFQPLQPCADPELQLDRRPQHLCEGEYRLSRRWFLGGCAGGCIRPDLRSGKNRRVRSRDEIVLARSPRAFQQRGIRQQARRYADADRHQPVRFVSGAGFQRGQVDHRGRRIRPAGAADRRPESRA
jgi:outer membrane receptor protein involved in Fe transport